MRSEYSKHLQLSQISAAIGVGCFDAGTTATPVGCMGWAAMVVVVGGRAQLCSVYAANPAMRRRQEARFGAERPQSESQAAGEAHYPALTCQRAEAEVLSRPAVVGQQDRRPCVDRCAQRAVQHRGAHHHHERRLGPARMGIPPHRGVGAW